MSEELSNEEQEWNNKEEYEEFIEEQDGEYEANKHNIWSVVGLLEYSMEDYMNKLNYEIEYIRDNIRDKKGEKNGDSINPTENNDTDKNELIWSVKLDEFKDDIHDCIETIELMIRNLRHDVKKILIKNKKKD